MYWSISESKTFKKCQVQWYFKNILASHRAKDPDRRRAYQLGKLQSVHSWRGKIVDDVISEFIVPEVRSRRTVTLQAATQRARSLFDRQLEYGRTQRLEDLELVPSQEGDDFVAFHKVVYGETLSEEEIEAAWSEVELALKNLFAMRELAAEIRRASYLVSQRALMFPHSGMTVRAVPDLIAFFAEGPPLIVDWKVHAFGVHEARVQLAVYAVALLRCNPHRDFPPDIARWRPWDVRLLEAQLLLGRTRSYTLTEEDVAEIESNIAGSATEMLLALDGRKSGELSPADFATAASPELCERCPYRAMCWEEDA